MFHLVQSSNYNKTFFGFPVTNLPHWVAEGSATFMGQALQEGERPEMYSRGWPNIPELQKAVQSGMASQVIDQYRTVEPTEIGGPGASAKSYFLGGLASEVLVASFGYGKLRDFSNMFADEPDIRLNFKVVYGFDLDSFYSRMAKYLEWWSQHELAK
jgi:hypothetical protein